MMQLAARNRMGSSTTGKARVPDVDKIPKHESDGVRRDLLDYCHRDCAGDG